MKMGDRRLKKLDSLGVAAQNKPALTNRPSNRAERRKLERHARHVAARLTPEDEAHLMATGHLPEDF